MMLVLLLTPPAALIIRCNTGALNRLLEEACSVFRWCDGVQELYLSCDRTSSNGYRADVVSRMRAGEPDVNA